MSPNWSGVRLTLAESCWRYVAGFSGARDSPLGTIAQALDAASSGTVIALARGTYAIARRPVNRQTGAAASRVTAWNEWAFIHTLRSFPQLARAYV